MSSQAKPLKYADLPRVFNQEAFEQQRRERIYTSIDQSMIDEFVRLFKGKNVLEAYAGRGHISALLNEQGITVKSTSLRQGHDASYELGHVFEVEDMDVVTAVHTYREWMDFLLVCWPTTDQGLYKALNILPLDVPIVFVGEVTDYTISPPFLGGCSCDEFFDNVHHNIELSEGIKYKPSGNQQLKILSRNETIKRSRELNFDSFSWSR